MASAATACSSERPFGLTMALRLSALSLLQMKLEYTQLHNDFIAFFEEKLEKVIASCGSSVREFYQLLRAADRKNSSGADARFTQVMLAAVEFEPFITLMKEMAREERARGTSKK